MKGRLNQAMWTLGAFNAIALFVVLYLAYTAGASANGAAGMGISDAMSASGKVPSRALVSGCGCTLPSTAAPPAS